MTTDGVRLGVLDLATAHLLVRPPRGGPPCGPAGVRSPLVLGPSAPAARTEPGPDLRADDHARGLGRGDPARDPRSDGRRQHIPEPAPSRQDDDHARPSLRRPGDLRPRCRVVRARAPGVRTALRRQRWRAPRLARGGGRPRRTAVPDGPCRGRRPALRSGGPRGRSTARAETPPTADRRRRREAHPRHGGASRGRVERRRAGRGGPPQGFRPARVVPAGRP